MLTYNMLLTFSNPPTMQIGDYIKFWRETRNYTEDYMASELGISQSAYSKLEKGKIKIDAERLFRISVILNINVEELSPHANNLTNLANGVHQNHVIDDNSAKPVNSHSSERELYEKLISEKDKRIVEKQETISLLKELLSYFRDKKETQS